MASCQSRKTGNCSDCSENKLLQEKAPEASPGAFLFLDRLPYVSAERGHSSTMATEKFRRSTGEANRFLDWRCACGVEMAQRTAGH